MDLNVQEIVKKYQANCDRIGEIADLCEKEQRERTKQEDAEYQALVRSNQVLQMKMQSLSSDVKREGKQNIIEATKILRENIAAGRQTKIVLTRDLMMVSDAVKGGIVPLHIADILDPLSEGLILEKVGLPFLTGLAGNYVWPTYEAVEATILNEGVALADTKLELSKLTANPQRIGIAMPVTRETINQTNGLIEDIIKKVIPLAVSKLLNKILFSVDKVGSNNTLIGPFVGLKSGAVEFDKTPTFLNFNSLKAKVLAAGVDGEKLCWVMTKAQKAIAEATPKDAGSGIMICENDKIAGLPVFTTQYIGEGYIGLGDWQYQPMGLFGEINLTIDPYTKSRNNAVDFIFNANYGTTTLLPKAFALAKVKS